jgi:hypothetical protein
LYNAGAWAIIKTFALEDTPLPETEKRLQSYLGPYYSGANWKAAFDADLEAEDDIAAAVAAIKKLESDTNKSQHSPLSSNVKTSSLAWPTLPQLAALKEDLMSSVLELHTCR